MRSQEPGCCEASLSSPPERTPEVSLATAVLTPQLLRNQKMWHVVWGREPTPLGPQLPKQ